MIVEIMYELKRQEKDKYRRLPNVYWVTDLVRCPLKREFEIKYPDLTSSDLLNPVFILGMLVHMGLEKILVDFRHAEVEVEKYKKVKIGEGQEVVISGRIDALIDKKIGVEIKTSRSDTGIPLEHHVLQCKIYNWLFDIDKTILVYVTPDRFTEYEVSGKLGDEDIVKLITEATAPRYDWECNYCTFRVICPRKKK